MTTEYTSLEIKKTCQKCGKTLDISNFSNFKDSTCSQDDYCKDCKELIAVAKDLNELIDIYGFGTEFSTEDLYKYFENETITNSKIKLLIEHDLLIKNQITNKFHFSDIVTFNNFIKENRIEYTAEENYDKENLIEPVTKEDYDFKEILTPLDEKYTNNFNPKQMNQTGIAWVSYNGISWIYQRRSNKNNPISFRDNDIFSLHNQVIKHDQPWGVRDFNLAEKFVKSIYSPFIETNEENSILNPLPEEYESRFNPSQASKTGIAWVTKYGDTWYYQRNINDEHIYIKKETVYELYKEVVNNNLLWGIRDYDKAKKYIKIPDDFKVDKKPKKIINTNNEIRISYSRTKKDEINVEIKGKIKTTELNNIINKLNFFILDIEKMELTKINKYFNVLIRLNINIALINKFEERAEELGWEIN